MKSVKDFLWRYRAISWILALIFAALMVMQIEGPVIFTWGIVRITLVWILGLFFLVIYTFVFYFSGEKASQEGEING